MSHYSENIIIGAGAAGLFCAAQLGKLGKQATIFDNGKKIGRKILMSGGGFCNFTNMEITSGRYISQNKHFVKSALKRYTQWDFIALVAEYGIPYHEKELGQLFCDNGAEDIVKMLGTECDKYGVSIQLRSEVSDIEAVENNPKVRFKLKVNTVEWQCQNLLSHRWALHAWLRRFAFWLSNSRTIWVKCDSSACKPCTVHMARK